MWSHCTVTVDDLLKLPSFANCKVLAGLSGLNRTVFGWSVAERFDFHLWIKGGEYIMSMMTFASDPDSENEISEWVLSLVESGASGLGIKRSIYNSNVPQFLLEIGDRNRFPIIEMDDDIILSNLGKEVFEKILDSTACTLKNALESLTLLTAAAVEGCVPGFIQKLASLLGNPAIIETPHMNFVASSAGNHVLETRALAARREERCVAEVAEKLKAAESVDIDPYWGLQFVHHHVAVQENVYTQLTFSVESEEHQYGYLSIIQTNKQLDANDFVLIRVSLDVLCLLAQKDATYAVQEEVRYELFRAIIDSERKDEAEHRAELSGFDFLSTQFCVIAQPVDPETAKWIFSDSLLIQIVGHMRQFDQEIFIVRHHTQLVLFCHLSPGIANNSQATNKKYYAALEYLQKVIDQLRNVPKLRIGAGRPGEGIDQIRLSYEEALAALRIAERFDLVRVPFAEPIQYAAIKYYDLLDTLLQNEQRAWLFCKDVLGPLMDLKLGHKETYYETLEAYLYYGRNLSEIRRNTGIHRNTVKYRIEKIQEVLGVELSDIEASISIWVALQIRKHLLFKNIKPPQSPAPPG